MLQTPTHSLEPIISEQYDQVAQRYDRRWKNYIQSSLQFFSQWANISPQETLLDVACGTGELERLLLAQNPDQSIVGVDISSQMLAQAQQKLEGFAGVSFQMATVRSLPFPDAHFDVILSASAFHYFDAPEAALEEMQRVLKPQGRILILDWCRDAWLCQVCDAILKFVDPAHRQCYTQEELHGFLQATQFQVLRSEKVRLNWLWELMAIEAHTKNLAQNNL